jgi:hypothetical protein
MFYSQDVLRCSARCFITQNDVLNFENILIMFLKFIRCFKFSKYLLDVSKQKHLSEIQTPVKDVQSTVRCFDCKMSQFVRCSKFLKHLDDVVKYA